MHVNQVLTGPPADRECAVEPKGVDTIKPSALYVATFSPLIFNFIEINLERDEREIPASLIPVDSSMILPARSTRHKKERSFSEYDSFL